MVTSEEKKMLKEFSFVSKEYDDAIAQEHAYSRQRQRFYDMGQYEKVELVEQEAKEFHDKVYLKIAEKYYDLLEKLRKLGFDPEKHDLY